MMAFGYDASSTSSWPVLVFNVTASTAAPDSWAWARRSPTYVGTTWAKPAKPPKNWRWFHAFSPVLLDLHWLGDVCWPLPRLLRRILMRCPLEARRHKRKQLVQRMRGAA